MKIDKDIQEAVADEFCRCLNKGMMGLFEGPGWAIAEMKKRQAERDEQENHSGLTETEIRAVQEMEDEIREESDSSLRGRKDLVAKLAVIILILATLIVGLVNIYLSVNRP